MQKLYQTFVAQAAQLQSVHENVKVSQVFIRFIRSFVLCASFISICLFCVLCIFNDFHDRFWSTSTFRTAEPSWKTPRTSSSPNGRLTGSGRVRRESQPGLPHSPVYPTLQLLLWQPHWPSNSSQLQVWLPSSCRKFSSSSPYLPS